MTTIVEVLHPHINYALRIGITYEILCRRDYLRNETCWAIGRNKIIHFLLFHALDSFQSTGTEAHLFVATAKSSQQQMHRRMFPICGKKTLDTSKRDGKRHWHGVWMFTGSHVNFFPLFFQIQTNDRRKEETFVYFTRCSVNYTVSYIVGRCQKFFCVPRVVWCKTNL